MADIDQAHRKLAIHFRFVGIPSEHLDRVREVLEGRPMQVANRKRHGKQGEVVTIAIDEDFPVAAVASMVRELGLSSDSYGVYISLVTDSDQDGLNVPESALRIIREVGGQLATVHCSLRASRIRPRGETGSDGAASRLPQ